MRDRHVDIMDLAQIGHAKLLFSDPEHMIVLIALGETNFSGTSFSFAAIKWFSLFAEELAKQNGHMVVVD